MTVEGVTKVIEMETGDILKYCNYKQLKCNDYAWLLKNYALSNFLNISCSLRVKSNDEHS